MTPECCTYSSPLLITVAHTHTHPNEQAHTYENRMAVWNLPIILYFTGPSLHRRCDWNNNHPTEPHNSPLPVGHQRTSRGEKKGGEMVAMMRMWQRERRVVEVKDGGLPGNMQRQRESRLEWHSLSYPPLWGNNPLNPACSFRQTRSPFFSQHGYEMLPPCDSNIRDEGWERNTQHRDVARVEKDINVPISSSWMAESLLWKKGQSHWLKQEEVARHWVAFREVAIRSRRCNFLLFMEKHFFRLKCAFVFFKICSMASSKQDLFLCFILPAAFNALHPLVIAFLISMHNVTNIRRQS